MARSVAIDLGTTFCSIAVPEPRSESGFQCSSSVPDCSVILDRFGHARIPARVAIGLSGTLVGSEVERTRQKSPAIRFAKRQLGIQTSRGSEAAALTLEESLADLSLSLGSRIKAFPTDWM